jgi:hypothetical protein
MFVLLPVEIGYQLGTNISRKSASVTVSGWLPLQLHMNVICYCFQSCQLTICDMILPLFLFILLQLYAQDNMTMLYIVWMTINFISTGFVVINKSTCEQVNIHLVRLFISNNAMNSKDLQCEHTTASELPSKLKKYLKKCWDFRCNKFFFISQFIIHNLQNLQ